MRLEDVAVEDGWIIYTYRSTYRMGWQDVLFSGKAIYSHLENAEVLTNDVIGAVFKSINVANEKDILEIPEGGVLKVRGRNNIYDGMPFQFIFFNQTDVVRMFVPEEYVNTLKKSENELLDEDGKRHTFDKFMDSIEVNATSMRACYNTSKTVIDSLTQALEMKENFTEERIYRNVTAGGDSVNLSRICKRIVSNWQEVADNVESTVITQIDPLSIKKILQQVKENTKTDCINIRTKICSGRLPLTCSKLGGLPYWPKSRPRPYPHSTDGRDIPLTMLAQINLADLPENDVFPNKGILQFFILNELDTDNFEVILHKEIEEPIVFTRSGPIIPHSLMPREIEMNTEQGRRIVPNFFWSGDGFPITGEFALEFSKGIDFVNPTENCFGAEFIKAAKQLNIPIPDGFSPDFDLPDEIYNEFYEYGCGHKLLGRPCFVQNDYREGENENDILLFQIDSACSNSGEEDEYHFINFGDACTAGFFIKKDDLKKLDFSRVFYDWACG